MVKKKTVGLSRKTGQLCVSLSSGRTNKNTVYKPLEAFRQRMITPKKIKKNYETPSSIKGPRT